MEDLANAQEGDGTSFGVLLVRGDWIILEASCDVHHDGARPPNVEQVLIAKVVVADEDGLGQSGKGLDQAREAVRRGWYPSKFMLSSYEGIDPVFPLSYVEYQHHFVVPHAYLAASATAQRLRLRHPLREQFGSWVGSCISRVGPEDTAQIPRFGSRLQAGQALRIVGD